MIQPSPGDAILVLFVRGPSRRSDGGLAWLAGNAVHLDLEVAALIDGTPPRHDRKGMGGRGRRSSKAGVFATLLSMSAFAASCEPAPREPLSGGYGLVSAEPVLLELGCVESGGPATGDVQLVSGGTAPYRAIAALVEGDDRAHLDVELPPSIEREAGLPFGETATVIVTPRPCLESGPDSRCAEGPMSATISLMDNSAAGSTEIEVSARAAGRGELCRPSLNAPSGLTFGRPGCQPLTLTNRSSQIEARVARFEIAAAPGGDAQSVDDFRVEVAGCASGAPACAVDLRVPPDDAIAVSVCYANDDDSVTDAANLRIFSDGDEDGFRSVALMAPDLPCLSPVGTATVPADPVCAGEPATIDLSAAAEAPDDGAPYLLECGLEIVSGEPLTFQPNPLTPQTGWVSTFVAPRPGAWIVQTICTAWCNAESRALISFRVEACD